jgi:hypothetical protein
MAYDSIDKVQHLSEDELLLIAGDQLLPVGFGIDERDDDTKKRDGRTWFETILAEERTAICANVIVRSFVNKKAAHDRILMLSAVADAVSGATSGVSPFVAAALFIHYGLEKLCADTSE